MDHTDLYRVAALRLSFAVIPNFYFSILVSPPLMTPIPNLFFLPSVPQGREEALEVTFISTANRYHKQLTNLYRNYGQILLGIIEKKLTLQLK